MKLSFTVILSAIAAVTSALPTDEGFAARSELVTRANDYPYSGKCNGNGGVDPWKFYRCQCTSFVAYRLNKAGVKFTNNYKGEGWHNANTWNEAAKKAGVKVNKTPKVGSVAQTDAGSAGHVAWVTKVGKKTVTIEEYNWNNPEKYGTRTVSKDKFRYIHIKN
ncbi:hypothetical protein DPSP01_007066 [Paraphaeosphaeria sporulosa]|uniref:CHAP-domain-containing protein n=1 Tax=Paraphaeosphaeria sporulosa TaxID=1460663 RepID=A0A177CGI5_9PLEO|nr:CHAP-domain-containing protein [Paraphaeosphaeria sporulosa]OAG05870.1 CHAP-domain-containing protein [Paraphaeosphaeria sporulosa]